MNVNSRNREANSDSETNQERQTHIYRFVTTLLLLWLVLCTIYLGPLGSYNMILESIGSGQSSVVMVKGFLIHLHGWNLLRFILQLLQIYIKNKKHKICNFRIFHCIFTKKNYKGKNYTFVHIILFINVHLATVPSVKYV